MGVDNSLLIGCGRQNSLPPQDAHEPMTVLSLRAKGTEVSDQLILTYLSGLV